MGGFLAGKLEPMAENRVKMSFFFTTTSFFDLHARAYSWQGVIQMTFLILVRIMTNKHQMASHGDADKAA